MKMLRYIYLAFCLSFVTMLASFNASAQAVWEQQANFIGAGRYWCSSFTIGDKIYVGLGYNPTGGSSGGAVFYSDFYEYNTTTNTWIQRPSYPGAGRLYVTGFSINGKGYFACGWYNGYQNDMWEYDPVVNAWAQKTSVPGPGRWGAVGFSIGNYGYVVTGDTQGNGQGCINGAYRYDQTSNLWMQLPNFPGTPVYGAAGFAIGNKGYVGTGYDGSAEHDEFYRWDEDTFSWSQMADFGGSPRYQNVGFAVGGLGYIGLGSSGNGDMWEYNPGSNTWAQTLSYPGLGLNVNAAAATSTAAYVGLGQTANQQWWKYTPDDCATSIATITASGPTELCQGSSVVLSASAGLNYLWSTGQSGTSIDVTESGTYSVQVEFADGCTANASTSVTVWPAPSVVANASQTSVCVGDTLTFSGSGALNYTWLPIVNDGVPFVAENPETGYYVVNGVDANGCSAKDSVFITVNPLPVVELDFQNQAILCANTGDVLLTEGLPEGGLYSGNGIANNALNTATLGVYTVTYTVSDANGCSNSATDQVTVEVCTGNEYAASRTLEIFPNPLHGNETLNIRNSDALEHIYLMDALGRVVAQWKGGGTQRQLDIENVPHGMYVLVVQGTKVSEARKLMVH